VDESVDAVRIWARCTTRPAACSPTLGSAVPASAGSAMRGVRIHRDGYRGAGEGAVERKEPHPGSAGAQEHGERRWCRKLFGG
jgi:hypothetical protein